MTTQKRGKAAGAFPPTLIETPAQTRLREKHGSPREFAAACMNALGEISIDEANEAISKYNAEWLEAGRKSK